MLIKNAGIKVQCWYAVQVSDTTMLNSSRKAG